MEIEGVGTPRAGDGKTAHPTTTTIGPNHDLTALMERLYGNWVQAGDC
jgi:hypothetical protein